MSRSITPGGARLNMPENLTPDQGEGFGRGGIPLPGETDKWVGVGWSGLQGYEVAVEAVDVEGRYLKFELAL